MIKSGIIGYVGDIRQGKTMSMVWDALHAMYHGAKVISNFPIIADFNPPFRKKKHLEATYIASGGELQNAISNEENAIFVVDETALYLPSNYWNKIDPGILYKFHQVGHYDSAIWYTVQEFNESVKRLRELTTSVVMCEKFYLGLFTLFRNQYFYRRYFDGLPTEAKFKLYYRGQRFIFPAEARRAQLAYSHKFKHTQSLLFQGRK
jgi:hypothetical protein